MKIYSISEIWNKKFKENIKCQELNLFVKRRLNHFLKCLNKKSKILDLGCGTGEKTDYVTKKGFNIIGIDSSKSAIAFAGKNFKTAKFYQKSIFNSNFKSSGFDAVISIAVFHCFLRKDRGKYVKEVSRILKKNGLLFQLALSSKDDNMKLEKEIETNTFLQKSRTYFHLFTENELRDYFRNFKFIELKHHQKRVEGKRIACFTMILKKK